MKILIYTDVHCSRTSSILPVYTKNSVYTTRLDMIIKSFKWMYSVAKKEDVDLIVNLGDLFDKNIVKSEELTAISECYKISPGIQEYHIVGNHELLDEDKKFYATSILNNYPFIKIFDEPVRFDDHFSMLPYMNPDDITFDLLKSIKNDILFSHIDIMGSSIRTGYDLTCGVDPEFLAMNFDIVFNGHIHKHGLVHNSISRIILNVGSMTSISFADSNTYIPGVLIVDTHNSKLYKFIENPECILFRKFRILSVEDLIKTLNGIDRKFKYVLSIECPYEIRNDIKSYLDGSTRDIDCIKYQVKTIVDNTNQQLRMKEFESVTAISDNINSEFVKFINDNANLIKYPLPKVESLIKEVLS